MESRCKVDHRWPYCDDERTTAALTKPVFELRPRAGHRCVCESDEFTSRVRAKTILAVHRCRTDNRAKRTMHSKSSKAALALLEICTACAAAASALSMESKIIFKKVRLTTIVSLDECESCLTRPRITWSRPAV